jgi:hypothetical protein
LNANLIIVFFWFFFLFRNIGDNMLDSAYEKRLLRQHNGNLTSSGSLEARPFTAALPPSGGFPGSGSGLSPVMAPPAKKVSGTL